MSPAPTLRGYFETADQQRRALDAATKENWLDPRGNLDLYEFSQRAFDPSLGADEMRLFDISRESMSSFPVPSGKCSGHPAAKNAGRHDKSLKRSSVSFANFHGAALST